MGNVDVNDRTIESRSSTAAAPLQLAWASCSAGPTEEKPIAAREKYTLAVLGECEIIQNSNSK